MPAAVASASSSVRTRSSAVTSLARMSASCATHRCARSRPRWSRPMIGTPDRPAHVCRLRAIAWFAETGRIGHVCERLRSGRRQVAIGVARIGLDEDEVAPVAAGIRESPRDIAVTADDHARQPGQRDTGHRHRLAAATHGQRCAIPDVRHVDREVHVVGDQRSARRRLRARNRPIVAAEPGGLFVAETRRKNGPQSLRGTEISSHEARRRISFSEFLRL